MRERENISSLELEKAMRFFAMLAEYPFVAYVAAPDGYHLYTKGQDDDINELMGVVRDG